MGAEPVTHTIVTTRLEEAYRHALAAMVPTVEVAGDAAAVQMFVGEGETPGAALADAVEAIREMSETLGGAPSGIGYEGSLRIDDGYRVWGTLTLGGGEGTPIPDAAPCIEAGEEGTWTVTITRG